MPRPGLIRALLLLYFDRYKQDVYIISGKNREKYSIPSILQCFIGLVKPLVFQNQRRCTRLCTVVAKPQKLIAMCQLRR